MPAAPLDGAIATTLAHFPEVAAAWLFGSEARGEARADSDLDIALLFHDRTRNALTALPTLGRIAAELERFVPGRSIDLILIEAQGPVFQHAVLEGGRLVYDTDPARRIDFESDAHVRYFDFLPTYQIASRNALAGFRHWFEAKR